MTIVQTKAGDRWSSIYPIAYCPQCEEPIELRAIPHYKQDRAGGLKYKAGAASVAWYEVDPCPNCAHVDAWTDEDRARMAAIARAHYSEIDEDTRTPYRMPNPHKDAATAYAIRNRLHRNPPDRLLELEQEQNRIRMAAELEHTRPAAELEQDSARRAGLNPPDEDSPDRQAPYYDATAGRIILRNEEK